jgi:RNA-binding protein YhbY
MKTKMKNQDYKLKYEDLKLKFMDAIDCSFRLGFEQGAQSAQMQQAQQQAQEAQMQAQQAQQMGQQPGQQDPNNQGSPDNSGSEMDQHISTLESMVNKQDASSPEYADMKKTLNEMKSLVEMKKSEKAISAIAKAMKPKFTIGKGANKNLSEHGKKALNDQERIVEDLMKSFAEEEKKASESIVKTLNFENLLKG